MPLRATHVPWPPAVVYRSLGAALEEDGPAECNLCIELFLVGSAGRATFRRSFALGRHDLRGQLLHGSDAVQQRLPLLDARGAHVANAWVSVQSNLLLEAICKSLSAALALPGPEARRFGEDAALDFLRRVVLVQRASRKLLARLSRRRALAEGPCLRVRAHSLRLPAELCAPEHVSAASLSLELAGVVVLRPDPHDPQASFRRRAGDEIVFEIERCGRVASVRSR